MTSMIDIFEHPSRALLPCKFEWGVQNFSFPTLFASYRELLLVAWPLNESETAVDLILIETSLHFM